MALLELFKEQLENESRTIAEARGLKKRGDYLIWWYFTKLGGLAQEEVEEVYCDGYNDYGIDAIRVDDSDETVHFYSFKNPESLDQAFPSSDVDKLLQGLALLIRGQLTEANANASLLERAAELKLIVPTAYRIHLVTSGTGISPDAAPKLDGFIRDLKAPSEDFCRWEPEDIQALQTRFYNKNLPTVDESYAFVLDQSPYQVRAANHDSYMFAALGSVLAGLFGRYGEALLQQNIRVSQGDRATNALIRRSATGAESGNFLHYNNGIVFLADTASWDQFTRTLTVRRFQVVNGGQTIRMLWNAHSVAALKADVAVPVRVITAGSDKDFASNVTVNLNNQNRIEPSFLRSNDPQVVQLASALASKGWHLERREAEVATLSSADRAALEVKLGGPLAVRTIPLTSGIQAYVATYMRQPELAKKFTKQIFLGAQDGGSFERVFSKDLTAEKVIIAHRLSTAVASYVRQFSKRKRRKATSSDWKADYAEILGSSLVAKHGHLLDQVVPPSTIFLTSIVFDDWVNVREKPALELVEMLESEDYGILNLDLEALIDVRESLAAKGESWPTLLKGRPLYEEFANYLRR
jgi:hypothetical protein